MSFYERYGITLIMNYTDFWKKLTEHSNILIGIHVNPDGDCIGSALAVRSALEKINIKATVFSYDRIPDYISFLRTDQICTGLSGKNFQALLLLDVNSPERTKIKECKIPKKIFIIDHHERENREYTEELIIPEASSTCEIIYDMFKENNIEITEETATDLLTGIICDTGGFRHSNTKGKVLKTAGELTDLGADPHYITKKYFSEKPLSVIEMTGYVIDRLDSYRNGEIIIASLDNKYISEHKLTEIDSDSVNLIIQSVKGHKITAFLREAEENKIRVSLRSPGIIDCNRIASKFGGGGHINASGCTIRKSLEEAKKDLLSEIEKYI